jgi:hypothetical protein
MPACFPSGAFGGGGPKGAAQPAHRIELALVQQPHERHICGGPDICGGLDRTLASAVALISPALFSLLLCTNAPANSAADDKGLATADTAAGDVAGEEDADEK